MPLMQFRFWFSLLCGLLVLVGPEAMAEPLAVGSKRFTESYILGEILTQTINSVGEVEAVHRQGLGNTGIVFTALTSQRIDLYPEYTGTLDQELLKNKQPTPTLEQLNRQLAPLKLAVGIPLGFNDTYALAMTEAQAQKLGIVTISDLQNHPKLILGLSPEFIDRADGWLGLQKVYQLPFGRPRGLDHGLAYEAIARGQIAVMDIYSTDAKIARYKLRVLVDDKKVFPVYQAVLLYQQDLPNRFPKTWAKLQQLTNTIDENKMIELNAQAELSGKSFAAVAQDFLAAKTINNKDPDSAPNLWTKLFAADLGPLVAEHLFLVLVSLGFGTAIGIPLGIWAARSAQVAPSILGVVGLLQTIPALALLAFLIPVLQQIGTVPALVALFLYALLPIVRSTYTGLLDIAPSLRESAMALGLPNLARLRLVELPLASRSILSGIKTAAVINVGTATIAAFIGAGGLGERIAAGLALNDNYTLLAGAIPAAGLALLVQFSGDLMERWVVPKGLQ